MNYENLKKYTEVSYSRVKRNDASYEVTEQILTSNLHSIIELYELATDHQSKRILRDLADFCLRRYHGYCIKEKIKAHYFQVDSQGETIFEHLIPAAIIRDLLLSKAMPIKYALNSPTVQLSRDNDKKLNTVGLVSSSANLLFPFTRYMQAGIKEKFVTFTGVSIESLEEWSLKDHFKLVGLEN
jgi:hypothetical protein